MTNTKKNIKEDDLILDLDGEVWTAIEGYNNKYYLSNYGRVKSFYHKQPHLIKITCNSSGYERASLWKKGKRTQKLIHRLVAEYYVPNDDPLHKTTVDHIDQHKRNNYYKNLQWLSLSDNIRAYYKKKDPASTPDQS